MLAPILHHLVWASVTASFWQSGVFHIQIVFITLYCCILCDRTCCVFSAGVIDDRGKFISITPEELDSVAQFIRHRGRVSITELAQASNSLINLMPESRSAAWRTPFCCRTPGDFSWWRAHAGLLWWCYFLLYLILTWWLSSLYSPVSTRLLLQWLLFMTLNQQAQQHDKQWLWSVLLFWWRL